MKKTIVISVSLIVCLFLCMGCGNSPATPTAPIQTIPDTSTTSPTTAGIVDVLTAPQGPPPSGEVPQYGGTLKINYTFAPSNLGAPYKAVSGVDKQLSRYAIENLVGLDPSGTPVPQLATSWTTDQVAKTITFTLRQGVNFQDGTPFDASAVKWNLDKYRSGVNRDLKGVTGVDVIDTYQVRLNLSTWDPMLIKNMSISGAGRAISPSAAQKLIDGGKEAELKRTPVGTGPFKFTSFQPFVSLKYTRWEGYWQKGLPYLDTVEINFVSDPMVSMTSFLKGEANCLTGFTPTDAIKLKSQGYNIVTMWTAISCICGDSKNESSPFSNINVRRAIACGLNSEEAVKQVFGDFNPSTNQLASEGQSGWDSTIQGYPYNPAKVKEHLAAAGYTADKPLSMKLTYTMNNMYTDLYTILQNNLKSVGINLSISPLDFPSQMNMITNGWNNQLSDYRMNYNPIDVPYSSGLAQALCADQYQYVSVWTPDDYNALYNTMLDESDMTKREAYYKQLNKMAIDQYCLVIPIMVINNLGAYAPSVHDTGMLNLASIEFLPERTWIGK